MPILFLALAILLQSGPVWLPLIIVADPAATATPSPTSTATATLTPTWAATATKTPTPTRTRTPTLTPTRTSTPTATTTPTWTPAATPTVAASYLIIGELRCNTSDEYVRVDNIGGVAGNLTGWRILSVVGPQTYYFPDYELGPGASVYVHSGPDAPPTSGNNLLWTTSYIWNNNNDQAQLITPGGAVVSQMSC